MAPVISEHKKPRLFHVHDVDSLSDTYQVTQLGYMQTTPGKLDARIYRVTTPSVEASDASYKAGVLLTAEQRYPRFGLGIGLSGEAQLMGTNLTNSNVGYLNGHNGVIARLERNTRWCNVTVDWNLIQQVAITHRYKIPQGDDSHAIPSKLHNKLAHFLSLIARGKAMGELNDAQFEDEVAFTVLRALNPPLNPRRKIQASARRTVALQVIDYIHAHYRDRTTITGLCNIAGVSERSLQYIFRDATGLSVQGYLMNFRLHQARKLLGKGLVSSVKEASEACGIPHAGRFSMYFKEMFDEYPADILARSGGRSLPAVVDRHEVILH